MSDVTAQLYDEKQRQRLVRRFGAGVEQWLSGVPATAEAIAEEWDLVIEGAAPHGRTSLVLLCKRADGTPAVVKITPDTRLVSSEAATLRQWAGTGRVPRVLGLDPARGALLMEAIGDGRTVSMGETVPPMEEIGALIADLHGVELSDRERAELNPLVGRINFVFDSCERRRAEGPAAERVPAPLLHHGHAWARALANGARDDGPLTPLHGDLHPGNVLDGGPERGLVAVDPRACLGDPAIDGIEWLVWRSRSRDEIRGRAARLAPAMGVPEQRLLDWAGAFAPVFAVVLADRGRDGTPEFDFLLDAAANGV